MALIDFTLSNARQFVNGEPLRVERVNTHVKCCIIVCWSRGNEV